MDEMRQLVRIMVKLVPASMHCLPASAHSKDGGGVSNLLAEADVREYLRRTLGDEAPQPEWGLPKGWSHYVSGAALTLLVPGCARCGHPDPRPPLLAELLSWATGRRIRPEDASLLVRRSAGR